MGRPGARTLLVTVKADIIACAMFQASSVSEKDRTHFAGPC